MPEPTLPEQPPEQEQQPEPGQFSRGDIREVKAQSQATVTLRGTCPPVPTLLRGPQERGTGKEAEKKGMGTPPPAGWMLDPQQLPLGREMLPTHEDSG